MSHTREKVGTEEFRSKRQQILDAAMVIFSTKGYHRATIDEIIALADTGKGTVYNYFVNKEQLFYTLIQEISQPFEEVLAEIADSPKPVLEKITEMIKQFLRFYHANADLWRSLMHEMRGFGSGEGCALSKSQQEKYREKFYHTLGLLEKVLREGVEQGVFKPCDTLRSAHALFSVTVTMVFHKLVTDDVDETAKMITDTFFYGVVPR